MPCFIIDAMVSGPVNTKVQGGGYWERNLLNLANFDYDREKGDLTFEDVGSSF